MTKNEKNRKRREASFEKRQREPMLALTRERDALELESVRLAAAGDSKSAFTLSLEHAAKCNERASLGRLQKEERRAFISKERARAREERDPAPTPVETSAP